MTAVDEAELQALRKRAYGPNPDIHLDPAALERLRHLEGARTPPPPAPPVEPVETTSSPVEPVETKHPQADSDADPDRTSTDRLRTQAARLLTFLAGLRRSTVLIALGTVLVLATLATVLTVVQRVQVDPLQAGAHQIARLPIDDGYDIPSIFVSPSAPSDQNLAFEQFHGLRAIVTSSSYFSTTANGCLIVYSSEAISDPRSQSFSGPSFSGCGAGDFPAMLQFRSDTPDLPTELTEQFPAPTGLQFVWDAGTREVVVFADR